MLRSVALLFAACTAFAVACAPSSSAVESDPSALDKVGCNADASARDGENADASCLPSYPTIRRSLETYECPAEGEPIKVAFLDADSTLRVSKKDSVTASAIDDVDVLPFVATTLKGLSKQGYLLAIVSNQGGVASGKTTYEVAEGGLVTVARLLAEQGAKIDYLDFAEADDQFRKPETGMADKLSELVDEKCGRPIDLTLSRMLGDSGYKVDVDGPHPDGRPADDFSNTDRLFAENLKIPFAEPTDAFGWREFEVYNVLGESELLPFLKKIELEAARLRESGDAWDLAKADELEHEVAENRRVNGLL